MAAEAPPNKEMTANADSVSNVTMSDVHDLIEEFVRSDA